MLQALSEKYNVAVRKSGPVMLPSWVEEIWTVSCSEVVTAQDSRFSNHKCLAMQVCLTALTVM